MKKRLTFLIILSVFSMLKSQIQNNSYKLATFSIFTPTFSLAPSYTFGYMQSLNERFGIGCEIGYGDYATSFGLAKDGNDYIYKNYKYYKISTELFYNLKKSGKIQNLLSGEIYYINHSDVRENSNFITEDEKGFSFYSADYKRIKFGFNLNYNILWYFTPHFILMPKIGFGLKLKSVSDSNISGLESAEYPDYGFIVDNTHLILNKEGSNTNVNLNFDLKFVYKF